MRVRGFVAVAVCLAAVVVLVALAQRPGPEAEAREATPEPGAAIVVNVDTAPDIELPPIGETPQEIRAAAERLRREGFYVVADPQSACFAATMPRSVDPAEIEFGEIPDYVLAGYLLELLTPDVLEKRRRGYFSLDAFTPQQRRVIMQLARQMRQLDANDRPTDPGTALMARVQDGWEHYVRACGATPARARSLGRGGEPPSAAAIPADPLPGSMLWWLWPYADADWGAQLISIPPGTYSVRALSTLISDGAGERIRVDDDVQAPRLAVAARRVPLRSLLWAVEVASGLALRALTQEGEPTFVFAARRVSNSPQSHADRLLRLPAQGYKPPIRTSFGRFLIDKADGPGKTSSEWTIGWRYGDMPLMWREVFLDDWTKIRRYGLDWGAGNGEWDEEAAAALHNGYVMWVHHIMVSVELLWPDGAGGGPELRLPTL